MEDEVREVGCKVMALEESGNGLGEGQFMALSETLRQKGIDDKYHAVLSELCDGSAEFLQDIECEDVVGKGIALPVARGLMRKIRPSPEISSPPAGTDESKPESELPTPAAAEEAPERAVTDAAAAPLPPVDECAAEEVYDTVFGTEFNRRYSAKADFAYVDPRVKRRVVVIGCTGAGKSTLLNVMAGNKFAQSSREFAQSSSSREATEKAASGAAEAAADGGATDNDDGDDFAFRWTEGAPLFPAAAGDDSVTKETSFAHLRWFGRGGALVAIDTPGHDDPAGADLADEAGHDALRAMSEDLHAKLKARRLSGVLGVVVLYTSEGRAPRGGGRVRILQCTPGTESRAEVLDDASRRGLATRREGARATVVTARRG